MSRAPSTILQRLRRARLAQQVLLTLLVAGVRILMAFPARWVLRLGDAFGTVLALLNGRARRAAYANLRAVFGPDFPRSECKRIVQSAWRSLARSALLLAYLQPVTPERYRRWVDVPEDFEQTPHLQRLFKEGGVIVSGHVGNWELLLALRILFPHLPPTVFLAEAVPHELINDMLARLRSHGDLQMALRRGGARAVARVVSDGGIAALLVDRNVRRRQGGIWVPFLGLEARTTPLAAWAALRYDKPIHPMFCLPGSDGRYRIVTHEDVTLGIQAFPEEQRPFEVMRRINAVLEEYVLADPKLWQWRLKRFKSRPTAERGRYPAYSEHDPD